MIKIGLVSITFRYRSVNEIINASKKAKIDGIEWGGDVHVPHGNITVARETGEKTRTAGLEVAAYGSYFSFDNDEVTFGDVLNTAIALGAPLIRVWAGRVGSFECSKEYYNRIVTDVQRAGDLAQKKGLMLAFEFHGGTITDTNESALKFMDDIGHSSVFSYWQPPVGSSLEDNLCGIELIKKYLKWIHVFHWEPDFNNKRRLKKGAHLWQSYIRKIREISGDRWALIEFVEDNSFESFYDDAKTLKKIIELKS